MSTDTDSDTLVRPPIGPEPTVSSGVFLANVQAARAVAVLLVVTYHLWPKQVPGGFAGVDVFFVISGFLITGHLTRELADSGSVSLTAFYARRIRRLLPVAFTVLVACVVAVVAILPMNVWPRSFYEITASALYVENWALAGGSADYFAAETPPTVVQHFWSLSVEEQFYLVWPLLFLLAALVARRFPARRRFLLVLVPALILLLSYLYSVLAVGSTPDSEYFSTFARGWEFAAGGLLAFSGIAGRLRGGSAAIVSWLGWAIIIGSGFLLNETMRFPGWIAAIPVLGCIAVIAGGTPSGRFAPVHWTGRLIRNRTVQFIGAISYSLYLWHWPVIILFGRKPGGIEDSDVNRFVLLGVSVLLAIATTYLIETPIRRLRLRRGLTFGLAAAGMLVVAGLALVGQADVRHTENSEAERVSQIRTHPPACFGAAAFAPGSGCSADGSATAGSSTGTGTNSAGIDPRHPVPSPLRAFADKPKTCMQTIDKAALFSCSSGPPAETAERRVAVIGDSHGMHWMPAFQLLAKQQHWHVNALLKGSCPLTDAVRTSSPPQAASCVTWNASVRRWLAEHPGTDTIFVASSSVNEVLPSGGRSWQQTAVQGYLSAWHDLPASVTQIFVLRDIPRPRPDVVSCSEKAVQAGEDLRGCGRPASLAIRDDPQAAAAAQSDRHPVVLDLNRYFCTGGFCSPEVGGAFVYRDGHHMTATFAQTLTPYLLAKVTPKLPAEAAGG